MIYQLKDGPLVIGYGRSLNEAVYLACDTNRRLGDEPSDETTMKQMIDTGVIKVREIREENF
jgi:hypothetical protein